MSSPRDLIPDFLLGALGPEKTRELELQFGSSPGLRRELDAAAEALAAGASAALSPVAPAPALRARLLDTLDGPERFAPFFYDLTALFELPLATMKRLLARIDTALTVPESRWEQSLLGVALEGAELFHFAVGPRLAAQGAAGGVVRIRSGVTFPRHSHNGNEVTYVLEGGYCADGRVYGPGSRIEVTSDVVHDYQSAPGRDLVIAVLHRGVVMLPGPAHD